MKRFVICGNKCKNNLENRNFFSLGNCVYQIFYLWNLLGEVVNL